LGVPARDDVLETPPSYLNVLSSGVGVNGATEEELAECVASKKPGVAGRLGVVGRLEELAETPSS
jgi:hypothetical protein